MKSQLVRQTIRYFVFAFLLFLLGSSMGLAQDKINLEKEEVMSWLERNWMWVVGGIVLLFIIALSGRRNRRMVGGKRKTTTVVKDADGKTKSVTTTEEPI